MNEKGLYKSAFQRKVESLLVEAILCENKNLLENAPKENKKTLDTVETKN